jgi:hypothetical protein
MSLSETLNNAELRTSLALRQIDDLCHGEHTHDHPKEILLEIKAHLSDNFEELKRAASIGDADIVRSQAASLTLDLDAYLPLLGFVLRSSNVRNAFEVFDPLIAMCSSILGPDIRLIYSSEWDYSPFTQTFNFPKLDNVVVVGLPAHESSNALIIPVVGHELGHSKWLQSDVLSKVATDIEKDVLTYVMTNLTDIVGPKRAAELLAQPKPREVVALFVQAVDEAQHYAKLQCEEMFCDVVGIRIFGASYLRAFSYLVFPSPKGIERRTLDYPSNVARAKFMKDAATYFGTPGSDDFGDEYDDTPPTKLSKATLHMIAAADKATELAFPRILKIVESLITISVVPPIDEAKVRALMDAFALNVPGNDIFNLPDIIEAAWRWHLQGLTHGERFKRLQALNELVFKTIEVSEFYRKTGK